MDTLSYDDLKKAIDLLGPRPPRVEVWVRDYIPSGRVFKLVLKDLPNLTYPPYTNLPGTEVIYLMNTEDFSTIATSEILRAANVPVFGPGGEGLG